MIKSFSGQVALCFAFPEPYLLMLAKTDYQNTIFTLFQIFGHLAFVKKQITDFFFGFLTKAKWLKI